MDNLRTKSSIAARWFVFSVLAIVWLGVTGIRVLDFAADRDGHQMVYVSSTGHGLVVDGFRTGGDSFGGLRIGDRIVSVGGTSTRTFISFRAAMGATDGPIVVRRDDDELSLVVARERRPAGAGLVISLALGVIGMLVAARSKRTNDATLGFVMLLAGTIGVGAPYGPSDFSAAASLIATVGVFPAYFSLVINWAQRFAWPASSTLQLLWAWLLTPIAYVMYISVYIGGPLPPHQFEPLYVALHTISLMIVFYVIFVRRNDGSARKRKQSRWFLATGAAYILALAALYIAAAVLRLEQVASFSSLASIVLPIGIALAILKTGFGDIDRRVSIAITYTILAVIAAMLVEFVGEPLAGLGAQTVGLPESFGQTVLVVLIAMAAPRAKRLLEPRVSRFFDQPTEAAPAVATRP